MSNKVLKELLRWLVVACGLYISLWIAGSREPKDSFPYFVTACFVWAGLWAIYGLLIYLLSRWRRPAS